MGDYKIDDKWRLLEPGMVLTIEPGLYLGSDKAIPKLYRDIGIRVEDDVVVTKDGPEVLTDSVVKEIADIEAH